MFEVTVSAKSGNIDDLVMMLEKAIQKIDAGVCSGDDLCDSGSYNFCLVGEEEP